jgi:hypothetical protein
MDLRWRWPSWNIGGRGRGGRGSRMEAKVAKCKGNLTDLRRELHLSLAKGNSQ